MAEASFWDNLKHYFLGQSGYTQQAPLYSPSQMGRAEQAGQMGMQNIPQILQMLQPQNFGAGFDPIAKQARSQFEQQTLPSIAERFTSMGGAGRTGGALSSPSFVSQLGQAGAGLEENLAAMKSNFGLQQQGQNINQLSALMNLMNMGQGQQFENVYHGRQPGMLERTQEQMVQAALAMLTGGAYKPQQQSTGTSGVTLGNIGNTPFKNPQSYANSPYAPQWSQQVLAPFSY